MSLVSVSLNSISSSTAIITPVMKSVNTSVADLFLNNRYVSQMGIRKKLTDEQVEHVRDDFKAFALEIGYGANVRRAAESITKELKISP